MMFASNVALILMLLSCTQQSNCLRCLSCVGTLQPWLCTDVRNCAGDYNECGLRKYRTLNGEIMYDLECVETCSANPNKRVGFAERANGSEEELLCEDCCGEDYCNTRGCGSAGYPEDRGLMCFDCPQINDPSRCSKLAFCRRGEMCAVFEEEVFGTKFYSSQCTPQFDCQIQPATVIGKRQLITKRCGSCCNKDYCNTECQGAIIPHPTGSGADHVTLPSHHDDGHKEFVLMYPFIRNVQNMYVFMATTVSGVVLVEVPYLATKRNITLNVGSNHIMFNTTMKSRSGGYVEHKGIYLKSSVPLSVWVMYDYVDNGGNVSTRNEYTGAYSAMPVSGLGTQYVVLGFYYQQFTIAALHDNTTVRIKLKLPYSSSYIVGISGRTYHTGSIITKTLHRLDTLCVTGSYMTGTTLFSDKDIAVLYGSYYDSYDSVRVQSLSPVSQWGTSFFIPSFPKIPSYYIYLQLAEVGGNTTVNVTSITGTQQYVVQHSQYREITMTTPPVYIESRKPLQVTVQTYENSSLPGTMVRIPSVSQYRGSYVITNSNTVTPGRFNENLIVVLPASRQNGLLVDGLRVHSNEAYPALTVNSTSYVFITLPMDGLYHVVTHSDSTVKFGAFVFGEGRLHHRYGYSHYGFPAGIE